ncbi:hypothetical protein P5837_22480, partial [Bacillus cereus]|uniref:hypothetical protein n=1 Tax=Bacillus cereus TaxID=1396 RepID=UPI0024062791
FPHFLMQPTSPLPSPQFRMEIDFASNLVAEATLWECDFLSHHYSRYWKLFLTFPDPKESIFVLFF